MYTRGCRLPSSLCWVAIAKEYRPRWAYSADVRWCTSGLCSQCCAIPQLEALSIITPEFGSSVELPEYVRGLECLQVKTRRTVPFLIDMKIFYALLKMSFGASYAPSHVDQFLLGHPLLYGVWHPYKYSVEIIYKAFAPIIKFLEEGWDLKAGAVVPMKVKVRHMEKTIVGLFLATAANGLGRDSRGIDSAYPCHCQLTTDGLGHCTTI